MGFITAVDLGRRKECKNPLDHVYSLLRFADDIDVELRERISIDYSPDAGTCWWKIFTMYGKIAIRSRPGLELLCYASSQHRPAGLPSWCPNLNFTREAGCIDREYVPGLCPKVTPALMVSHTT